MDARAFEQMVSEHQNMVYGVALATCRDRAAAEDVAQEAFLKAYRSADRLRKPARLKTWLYSVARFTAIDWVRKHRRERVSAVPEAAAPGPAEDRGARVMEAIRGLRDDYREVLILHYLEGLSYAEVARALGTTPGAVGEKLHRVREMVREKLQAEARP